MRSPEGSDKEFIKKGTVVLQYPNGQKNCDPQTK